jgi:hypothetical protein
VTTITESTIWLISVLKLLRTQRCLPFVTRFQKWYSWTSQYCAAMYASIDAKTAPEVVA